MTYYAITKQENNVTLIFYSDKPYSIGYMSYVQTTPDVAQTLLALFPGCRSYTERDSYFGEITYLEVP